MILVFVPIVVHHRSRNYSKVVYLWRHLPARNHMVSTVMLKIQNGRFRHRDKTKVKPAEKLSRTYTVTRMLPLARQMG